MIVHNPINNIYSAFQKKSLISFNKLSQLSYFYEFCIDYEFLLEDTEKALRLPIAGTKGFFPRYHPHCLII